MRDLVSVIIPYFNRHEALQESVLSVLNQSYRPLQVLLVNDGGSPFEDVPLSDDTISFVSLSNPINSGASAARNLGLANAKGDFIAFLDSDDIWLPDKLEKQIEFMKSNDIDFSHTSYIRRCDQLNQTQILPVGNTNYSFWKIALRCKIATPTVCVRRDVIKGISFDPCLRVGEDVIFWLALAQRIRSSRGLNLPLTIVNVTSTSHYVSKDNTTAALNAVNKFLWDCCPVFAVVHWCYMRSRSLVLRLAYER
jgi:glycosyltransferase involved in cell wall biosynthesis